MLTVLREPADRAFSDYLNRVRSGDEGVATFATAIAAHPEIVEAGKYARWLPSYLEKFGPDNLKVAVFDDLSADPQAFLTDITDWLGISPLALSDEQREPARAAAKSRSLWLTKALRQGAAAARQVGLEGFVGRMKSSSHVEAALYRTYDTRPSPDASVMAAVRSAVADDVACLTELTGIPFAHRWGYR